MQKRDGEADLLNRRLANREDFFDGLVSNPIRSRCRADRKTFLMFNAIADHMPELASARDPERPRSPFINGIKHWQVDY